MRIDSEFDVHAPVELVWPYLLDVEKVAPCVPGAELTEVVDDHTWKGKVVLKLGPVSLSFAGTVTIQERDDENHRVALKAEGREQRGKGAATATSTSMLTAIDGGSRITIQTDLVITGAVAQYGRGMIGDVSQKLIQQFADCLQSNIAAAGALSGAPPSRAVEPAVEPAVERAVEPAAERADVPASDASPVQPASGLGGGVAPVEPARPAPRMASSSPTTRARPVGGIRLGLWALWRAILRLVNRLLGRRPR